AITKYVARMITGSGTITISNGITRMDVPYLSKIPVIGPMLFSKSYITTYIVILVTLFIYYFLHKTIKGLRLKACGENPWAADSLGINVIATRYIAVFVSGCLAGLGGAIIILTYQGEFSGSVSGLGFLALSTLIFGKWDPLKVMGASFLFGFARAFASMSSLNDTLKAIHLPMQFYNALPYIITIIGLVLLSKNAAGPKSAGKPFRLG
ncbi:ABC transporter permease, partial [Neobacillus drentensis]|uniref:ABC transporter permease n=1 Tax=Neobacillus drentensis TaxID=220684 RepID=UPI00300189A9